MRTTEFLTLGGALVLALAAGPALAAQVALSADLTGAAEPEGGDADGTGSFTAEIDPDTGDVCYTLASTKIAAPTAAHIHEGAAGTNGKPVIPLTVTGPDDDSCVAAEPDLLKAIVAAPQNYYVNIHTGDYPKGAVRGQLSLDAGD